MVALPLFGRKKSPAPQAPASVLAPALVIARPALPSPPSPRLDMARDFARPPPSSVRHLRVLSVSLAAGLDEIFSPLQLVRRHQRDISHDLPRELVPVVNLIHAQGLRQYAAGPVSVVVPGARAPIRAHAALIGTELQLQTENLQDSRYLNVQDCAVRPLAPEDGAGGGLVIWQDFDSKHVTLRCDDADDTIMWLAAFELAKYEQAALNEAFTGVVLLLKGPALSDISTLLAPRKRFARFEWCNMRLPQVLSKWVKVFVAVTPGDGKKSGRVEIYTSDKMAKRLLVVYINSASAVYNVYPEDHKMIDFNLMMKLEGEVFVNRNHESVFHHDTAQAPSPASGATPQKRLLSRVPSLLSLLLMLADLQLAAPLPLGGRRERSGSILSTLSFFEHAASPDPEPALPRSPTSTNFFKKQTATNFVTTDHLYLMPLAHPGVSGVETMIRNWIHLVDTFRLYGRPERLSSDKSDPQLMLFGLPHLPCYGYLSMDDAYAAVDANLDTARFNAWSLLQWKDCFKKFIHLKQLDLDYKGVGHIKDLFLLVDDLDNLPSPRISLPKQRVASPLRHSDVYSDSLFGDRLVPPPLQMTRDDTISSLGPIADIPTPLDDGKTAYFDFEEHLRLALGISL